MAFEDILAYVIGGVGLFIFILYMIEWALRWDYECLVEVEPGVYYKKIDCKKEINEEGKEIWVPKSIRRKPAYINIKRHKVGFWKGLWAYFKYGSGGSVMDKYM